MKEKEAGFGLASFLFVGWGDVILCFATLHVLLRNKPERLDFRKPLVQPLVMKMPIGSTWKA